MKKLKQLLMECELDGTALVAKLYEASARCEVYDPTSCSQLHDMAVWLDDVVDDLARMRGAPRDVPDYHGEALQ